MVAQSVVFSQLKVQAATNVLRGKKIANVDADEYGINERTSFPVCEARKYR